MAEAPKRKITDEEIRTTRMAAAPLDRKVKDRPQNYDEFEKTMDFSCKMMTRDLSTAQFTEHRNSHMMSCQAAEPTASKEKKKVTK